jgi:hypothetical protein
MVHKAAGHLRQYLQRSSPNDIIELYFIALNQKDPEIMASIMHRRSNQQLSDIMQMMSNTLAIRKVGDDKPFVSAEMIAVDIPVRALIFSSGSKKEVTLLFQLRRVSLWQPWKIENIITK